MYLEVSDVKKSYGEGGSYIQVLKGVSLQVKQGDMCVIQGTSGSGKSTLLNCIGGLDTIESGSIKVDGIEIAVLLPASWICIPVSHTLDFARPYIHDRRFQITALHR